MATSPESKSVIVNVSDDSESKLEDLFNVLTNEKTPKKRSPFAEGLPSSFHQMPDNSEKTVGPFIQVPQMGQKGANHNRGISLPVNLEAYQRNSLDFQSLPLPPGWEVGKTPEGHSYYINHNERRTQWEDPRLQAIGMTPPTDHAHLGLHQRPGYPGGDQLTHHQPHPHHLQNPPYSAHFPIRHPSNNHSLDITPIPGMGGIDSMTHYHSQRPHSGHQHAYSFGGGHMHSHMGGSHYGMGIHGQLQSKRSFDLSLMEHHANKVPVTLQGDPYLSEHGRQASHDSGLGYPVTPYQDHGMMDYEEGFDGNLQSMGHMGGASNQINQERNHVQGGVPVNHGLLDHLPSTGELGGEQQQQQMEFGGEMLGEFGNHGNPIFGTGEWV